MSVLTRYLLREIILGFLGVTVVLVLVMSANVFVQSLALAADGSIPRDLIPWLVVINGIKLLSYVLPASLFLGLMFALGRLSRDSELSVMRACGAGPFFMLRSVMLVAVPVALLSGWLSMYAWPAAQASRDAMIAKAQSLSELRRVPTGRFFETPDGQIIAYVADQRADVFEDVFLYTLREGKPSIEFARQGELVTDPDSGVRFVELRDGRRYEGLAGEQNFIVTQYQGHRVLLPGMSSAPEVSAPKSTLELLQSDSTRDHGEFLKRLGKPLSVLALAFLAVPLAQTRPRAGRYGRLAWGVLIYAIYFNLLGTFKSSVARGQMDLLTGVMLLPVMTLLLALMMLWIQGGGMRRLRARWQMAKGAMS
ncbi:MAG TPA: LPS export ABC transporter permease LptF [Halothiobacillus sp.]|nr:LPS export ABC transporter permease LptF [Halothiobacillus sp.]